MAQEGSELYRTPVAQVLGINVYTGDPAEMQHLIISNLLENYAGEQGIEVSDFDIKGFLDQAEMTAVENKRQHEERRREIILQLESKDIAESERENLMSELDALYVVLENVDKKKTSTPEYLDATRTARVQVATAMIRQWKINGALYRQYGGRIIFQQAGPEPLDAYRYFLEEQEDQGNFTILNKEYADHFWKYFTTDSMHSFYDAGSKEKTEVFTIPWWLVRAPEKAN